MTAPHDDMSWLDELNATAQANGGRPIPNQPDDGDVMGPTAADKLRARLITGRAVLDLPEPGYIIDKVVPERSVVIDYGPPKSAKSFVALDQAMCVATGRPWAPSGDREWAGGYSTTQGSVVYVAAEGVGGLGRRVSAWLAHHHLDDPGPVHWLTRPVNLTDLGDVAAFLEVVGPLEPVMVTFDTLARCSAGADENSARDMGQVVASLDHIRDATGATVRAVHHAGKDITRGMRGSTALLGAADAVFEVTRDGRTVKWRCTDMKDAEEPRPIVFRMVDVAGSIALAVNDQADDPAAVPTSYWATRDTLTAIDTGDGVTSTVWLKSTVADGVSEATYYRAKKWLLEHHYVTQSGKGRGATFAVRANEDDDAPST